MPAFAHTHNLIYQKKKKNHENQLSEIVCFNQLEENKLKTVRGFSWKFAQCQWFKLSQSSTTIKNLWKKHSSSLQVELTANTHWYAEMIVSSHNTLTKGIIS